MFAAEALGLLLVGKRLNWRSFSEDEASQPAFFKPLLMSLAAATVGCLPGVLGLTQVFERKANWSDLSSPASVFSDALDPLLFWIALPLLILASNWLFTKYVLKNEARPEPSFHNNRLMVFVFLWALTPIAGVLAAHYFEIAPLAMFRYTLIGTPAMAIFAGLAVGQMPNALIKVAAIVLIAWSSFQNNQVTRQLVTRQTLPVLRHENWESNANEISGTSYKDKQPILLFANVIEDAEAASNLDPRFQDYLRFPAYNIHDSTGFGRQVSPCSTHNSPRVPKRLAEQVLTARGGWLLIRGTDATVQSILAEVEQTLADNLPADSNKQIQIEERDDDGDVVHLFSVDLR